MSKSPSYLPRLRGLHRFSNLILVSFAGLALLLSDLPSGQAAPRSESAWASGPSALALSRDSNRLYVACEDSREVLVFDPAQRQVVGRIATPEPPSGLALSGDGTRLFVTCSAPVSSVLVIDTVKAVIADQWTAGHTAMAPVLGADEEVLYVCNRFNHNVVAYSVKDHREVAKIPAGREPVAAALTPDGERLVVVNHLHNGRADADIVAAEVVVISASEHRVLGKVTLGNGSGVMRGVAISPDGRFAAVTHILARYHLPTTQVDRGWMNCNALSFIDLNRIQWHNTVLLDDLDQGAANPWGVVWTADGKRILVAHAGTHELSVIDAPGVLEKLAKLPSPVTSPFGNAPDDLAFLVGLRRRVPLPGNGPRAVALAGDRVYAGNHYSDDLNVVEFTKNPPLVTTLALGPAHTNSVQRLGEAYFNDARLCFQTWQSCASCHSSDARVDGLNWDLLNDGIGNPKNSHSLLLSHRTPPAMSQGVRESAEMAVRAGIRHIQFSVQPAAVPQAIDEYLKSLKPIPSPFLEKGGLSAAAKRGKSIFRRRDTQCAKCHPGPLFTTLKSYDVGTRNPSDTVSEFDTPSLFELWRTAPFLHDGSARSLQEVLRSRNEGDRHGMTSHLTPAQIDDLVAYLLSL